MRRFLYFSFLIFSAFSTLAQVELPFVTTASENYVPRGDRYSQFWSRDQRIYGAPQRAMGTMGGYRFEVPEGNSIMLTTVRIALAYDIEESETVNLTIRLVKDTSIPSQTSENIIETLAINPLLPRVSSSNPFPTAMVEVSSSLRPVIPGGSSFWITFEPTTLDQLTTQHDTLNYVYEGDLPLEGRVSSWNYLPGSGWSEFNDIGLSRMPAIEFRGIAVPEPKAMHFVIFGLPIILLLKLLRQKFKGRTVEAGISLDASALARTDYRGSESGW